MKRINFLRTFLFLLTISCFQVTYAADGDSTAAAIKAANHWLVQLDAGEYGQTWEAASPFLKDMVTKTDWERQVGGLLSSYGAHEKRTLLNATHKTELPGAPDGHYVIIQYKSSFEKKTKAIETVTFMRCTDGAWRLAGYFIK